MACSFEIVDTYRKLTRNGWSRTENQQLCMQQAHTERPELAHLLHSLQIILIRDVSLHFFLPLPKLHAEASSRAFCLSVYRHSVITSITNTRTVKLSNNTGEVQEATVSTVPRSTWGALTHTQGTLTCFQITLATTLDVRINGLVLWLVVFERDEL